MIEHTASTTEDDRVRIVCASGPMVGSEMVLDCTFNQYNRGIAAYKSGKLMQEAFSFLSAGQCEFLISGLDDGAWNELFKEQY